MNTQLSRDLLATNRLGRLTRQLVVLGLLGMACLTLTDRASAQQRKVKPRGIASINDAQPKFQSGQVFQRSRTVMQTQEYAQQGQGGVVRQHVQSGGMTQRAVTAAIIEEPVVVPERQWALLVDGWFDYEGLNIDHIPHHSPLNQLNSRSDRRGQTYRLEPGDVITHIDGQPVSSYEDYFYALNFASNPRNLQIEVINWRDGSTLRLWASARKIR